MGVDTERDPAPAGGSGKVRLRWMWKRPEELKERLSNQWKN